MLEIQKLKYKNYNTQNRMNGIDLNDLDSEFITTEDVLKEIQNYNIHVQPPPNEKFMIINVKLDPTKLTIDEALYRKRFYAFESTYKNTQAIIYHILKDRTDLVEKYKGEAVSPAETYGTSTFERYLIWKQLNFDSLYHTPLYQPDELFCMMGKLLHLTIFYDDEEYWDGIITMDSYREKGEMFYYAHFDNTPSDRYNYYAFYECIFLPILMQLMHRADYYILKELLFHALMYYSTHNQIVWRDNDGEVKSTLDIINTCLYSALSTYNLGEYYSY